VYEAEGLDYLRRLAVYTFVEVRIDKQLKPNPLGERYCRIPTSLEVDDCRSSAVNRDIGDSAQAALGITERLLAGDVGTAGREFR
jgi:hypothetical protein